MSRFRTRSFAREVGFRRVVVLFTAANALNVTSVVLLMYNQLCRKFQLCGGERQGMVLCML